MLTKGADIRTPKKHKQIHKHKNMKVYTKIHGRVHTNRIWNLQTKKDQYSVHTSVQGQHTVRKVGTENIHTSTQQHGTLHISTQQKDILHTRNSVISWGVLRSLGIWRNVTERLMPEVSRQRNGFMFKGTMFTEHLMPEVETTMRSRTSSTTEPVSRLRISQERKP